MLFDYWIEIRGNAAEKPILDVRFQGDVKGKAVFEQISAIAHKLSTACDELIKVSDSQVQERATK